MWFVFALLAVVFWSIPVVLDSVLVRNFVKNPFVLMWSQSCVSLVLLSAAIFFVPLQSAWLPWIVAGSILAYAGDLVFFIALDRVDASVINIAWAFLAIFLSGIGFFLFGETWSHLQTFGVVLVLSGVVFLSLRHHQIGVSAVLFLVAIAALYTPTNAIQKAALDVGELTMTVVFWQLFARELLSFVFAWCIPSFRRDITVLASSVNLLHYVVFSAVAVTGFFLGMFFVAEAYRTGPLSLVSVIANVQPFTVLFLSWMLWRFFPRYVSKELLDSRSVLLKLGSFATVFVGLVLLLS